MKWFFALVVGVVCLGVVQGQQKGDSENAFQSVAESKEGARFLKAQQVTTFTDFVFTTKTIFPQCVSSVQAGSPCTGKRRRRRKRVAQSFGEFGISGDDDSSSGKANVEGSLLSDATALENSVKSKSSPGKFGALTIWTTTRTTATATVKFTNTSTTLSLVYLCTGGNVEFPSQFSCITG